MFLDATAIVAILTGGPAGVALARKADGARNLLTTPLAIASAVVDLAAAADIEPAQAEAVVSELVDELRTKIMPLPPASNAVEAFARFGEGRHSAGLTLDQCMSYAAARYYRQPLLFAGAGFALTDIQPA